MKKKIFESGYLLTTFIYGMTKIEEGVCWAQGCCLTLLGGQLPPMEGFAPPQGIPCPTPKDFLKIKY